MRAISNVHADRIWPAGRRFPTHALDPAPSGLQGIGQGFRIPCFAQVGLENFVICKIKPIRPRNYIICLFLVLNPLITTAKSVNHILLFF